MNPLYEKKCDCNQYDSHRSALLKMELPDYEDVEFASPRHTVFRALRLTGYVLVTILLGYCLWRIHAIESSLSAHQRLAGLMRGIDKDSEVELHRRVARSVLEPNGFDANEKGLPRGGMLSGKHEGLVPRAKPRNREEFEQLVNSLFDRIQAMHNDAEREHFDQNMRAVFQAWFPVFNALIPKELVENAEARKKSDDLQEVIRRVRSLDDSSEEDKKDTKKSSEESSEENKPRQTRSADGSSEESAEKKKSKKKSFKKTKPARQNSDESSEERNKRHKRSAESSEESSESSEEKIKRYEDNERSVKEQLRKRQQASQSRNKESEENSSDSSDSSESKEAPSFVYRVDQPKPNEISQRKV